MSINNSDYIKKTVIVANTARTVAAGTIATKETVPAGECVVTDQSGVILDTTTVVGKTSVNLFQGRGATKDPIQVKLKLNEITSYLGAPYVASQEQISYFGFNGTSGSIDAINSNYYVPSVAVTPNTMFLGARNVQYFYGPYKSDASATQAEVALGFQKSLVANFALGS